MTTKRYSLWLLKARTNTTKTDNPWNPWYDKAFGFVVSARTEEEARRIANDNGGDECGQVKHTVYRTGGDPWLDPKLSTCEPLKAPDTAEVIFRDLRLA